MKALKIILCVVTALSIAACAASIYYTRFYRDTVPPEFTMDSDTLNISVKDGDDVLLQGIKATDDRDGDLTSEIILGGVSQLTGTNTARVNYIVFDHSDNMTTISRKICYTDYQAPQFTVMEPLTFDVGETVALKGRVFAKDSLEGNITNLIRVSTMDLNNSVEGIYHITLRVMNRMGDSNSVTLPVIIRKQSAELPVIKLKNYLLYLSAGEEFDPEDYFEAVYSNANSHISGSYANLTVTHDVDTQTPGSYEVRYAFTNASNYSTETILTVVVENMEEPS